MRVRWLEMALLLIPGWGAGAARAAETNAPPPIAAAVPPPAATELAVPPVAAPPDVVGRKTEAAPPLAAEDHAGRWWRERFEIGLRSSLVKLDDPTSEKGFIGTITKLDEEQSAAPRNLLLAYNFNRWFSLAFAWDQTSAKAVTSTADRHVDGEFEERGPTFTLVARYPLPRGITPYLEAGVHFISMDFDTASWWGLGYASPADYRALGSPGVPRHGKRRYLDTDAESSAGFIFGGGVLFSLSEHWRLDLAVRHIDADAESHFYITQGDRVLEDKGVFKVPFSHTVYSAGLRYLF